VRRAYLCGEDFATGQNFEHRRGWIETRIRELASIFAIDVAAYSVMSNHYHIVLRVDEERTADWTEEEVLRRWTQLFTGPLLVQRYLTVARDDMSDSERSRVGEWVETYRERLHDLSWFMRVLNETVARMANAEDECTGRFWEGRFKSQALLDEQAVLMAMSYVDLNPIRAGMAETPEQSAHTSVKQRVEDLAGGKEGPSGSVAGSAKMVIVKKSVTHFQGDQLRSEADLRQLPVAPLLPFEPTETLATN
jgi:REP element-mobilizing transposase RayT